ncbi:SDR family NAD(P)-dependent oxidoreductase [Streptomyces sp. NPDC001262]|uniref:SDR family NAD(P)-dependent oxidoreductase n=1 Tax=Streptomyces sp. NPDC001262 TaxID=3364552 RepID=UPI0036C21F57
MSTNDVAIIGLALKFPGSDTLEELLRHLVAGRSLISEVPAERWSKERWYGSPKGGAEKTSSIWGGFVEQADCFDASFFGISPREAESMDPQQRFALELAWKAIEDAGYRASAFAGTKTGVFMGVCHADYAELMEREGVKTDVYFPTGTAYSIIANRISYILDLQGPSITNDTACSSSLVSVYEAVSALQNGECGLALAGGVNLAWSPKHFVAFSQASMLSRTGRSRAFDQSADGYVRGEGGAVLLLKPLARAVEDGDPIHAVIKGIATNHGGKTSSLTVTNPAAQSDLIQGLYDRAGIRPETVSYIEAHGPGTPVGDPIEIVALKRAFANLHAAQGTEAEPGTCGIGSVKTNIGHLEGAAGVAGMAKVIGALATGTLPATVGFEVQNKLIKLDGSPFRIVGDTRPWPAAAGGAPRRAGVSSFGFGGTNAHVVLEEHRTDEAGEAASAAGPHIVPLSAKTPERLRAVARALLDHLRAPEPGDEVAAALRPPQALADIAYTLQSGREPMPARVAFVVADTAELRTALASFANGTLDDGKAHGTADDAATRWAEGGTVDWSELGSTGRRLRLPTYPFARERHWFRVPETTSGQQAVLHPLVHRNTSDLSEQRYSSVFTGDEPFLAAHQVRGARVLPAVAYVEMTRAAVEYATGGGAPLRLRDVAWLRPLVADGTPVDVHVGLVPGDDGRIAFEVYSGLSAYDPAAVVHSQGAAELCAPEEPVTLDLDALRAACPASRAAEDVYAAFRAQGLEYGPAMRGMSEVHLGSGELLARIVRPAEAGADEGVVLPPSVLDAAFQASLVLMAETADAPARGPVLPFALEQADVHGPCPSETWAWVRRREGSGVLDTFDIDLCDADGVVAVRLRGLVQRVVAEKTGRVVTATSGWADAPVEQGAAATLHGFVAGKAAEPAGGITLTRLPDVTPDRLADGVDAVLGAVFARVKELLASRPGTAQRCVVLVDDRVPRHVHAPLTGLFRTVALENPLVSGRVVRVPQLGTATPRQLADVLRAEAADTAPDAEIRYAADGTRQAWRPADITLGDGPEVPPLKEGGVYWLTGGLGGLGRHFARYLARCAGTTVVLSGRTADEEALTALREAGVDAHFVPADVTDKQDVERAVRTIVQEHGSLDGIVHAAGVLRDAYVLHKDADDLPAVMAPKVRGVLNLDAATRDLALDFFAVFSSVAGVYGNSGQSDYAAANAFLDAFAAHRQTLTDVGERSGRTVAVSWPLWADGGMTADAVTQEAMRRQRGWEPLPTEPGLRVFGHALGDGPGHVVVAYGADATMAPEGRAVAAPAPSAATAVEPVAEGDLAERTAFFLKRLLGEVLHRDPGTIDPEVNLVEYGIDSLSILETTGRLEDVFGPLSKTIFFEYVNIEGVAGYFAEAHREKLEAVLAARATTDGPQSAHRPEARGEAAGTPSAGASRPGAQFPAPLTGRRRIRRTGSKAPQAEVAAARDDYHDIAVIGISGRYPGAETLDELWSVLEEGRHSFEEVPRDRWDHDALYSRDRDVLGKSVIRTGTFLRGIDEFDPRYFRISKREAERMSPEVRLFLQAGVEALEDAGYSRETIQRQYQGDVGVLVGTMSNHYNLYGFQNNLTRGAPASGSYTGTLPNMLSYFYGLTGPSVFLDTMCSGSSTCVHQAVQMLRNRECRMAVAGGANLLLHPYNLVSSSQEHFTTATSDVIRSFGLGADGTILGEGVGAVVLKPLVEAERDGDHVYAVIKGTALSNAGVRNGFTVPNPHMQARAIEKAIEDAGVDPRTITYVEGHGSGTSLGDPIEVKALTTAFRKHTDATQFCALGSVKSNMGHLLHAAGMVGLAKVLLQLREGTLVPSLHSSELNPDIDFAATPFRVQRELAPWEPVTTTEGGRTVVHPRRAGITSIGAGGMNSHIVLEEYVPASGAPRREHDGRAELFVFSAMTDEALAAYLTRFREYLAGADEADLPAIAFTLRVGKNELPRRWAFFARDAHEAAAAIGRYLAGDRDLAALAGDGPGTATARELATAWVGGKRTDWDLLDDSRPQRRVSLPAYPFERVRCWVEQEDGAPSVLAPLALRDKVHPLLGRNESDVDGLRYGLDVHLGDLADYGLRHGRTPGIVPTFAVDMAFAAARVSGFAADAVVSGLRLAGPADWTGTARLVTTFTPAGRQSASGVVSAEDASGARVPVAQFTVRPGDGRPAPAHEPLSLDTAVRTLDKAEVLAELADSGTEYEPLSSGLTQAYRLRDGRIVLGVAAPELQRDHARRNVALPPFVLAAVAQAVHLAAQATPRRIDEVRLYGDAAETAYVLCEFAAGRIRLLSRSGAVLGEFTGVHCDEEAVVPAVAEPAQAPADSVLASVVDELRDIAAGILKFEAAELDVHTTFDAFGFDSISLVSFAKQVQERLGADLSPAAFFDVNTLDALGRHLVADLGAQMSAPAAEEAAAPVVPAPDGSPVRIAVIGAAGRFPGAPDLAAYWANLADGKDSVSEFPLHRYDAAYRAAVEASDFPRHAGVLDDVDAFDAGFFQIFPREAELMDPQHRLALETVWNALEDSAYQPADLPKNTGLFLGVSGTDYAGLLTAYGTPPDAFTSTGNAHSMLVNRISYVLDVRGPSEPVDTACSSSLVAVHRAVEAIRSGACDVAVAGGVNLLLSVDTFVSAHRAGMLSPDGRCKTFSADANGYVRGEGVGAVVLKPLDAAERDGDAILGVIVGSAENHGGRANSLTAPNADAQAELVTAAMGGTDPDTIGYIEAHGTGTALGDPVEVRALQTAFRRLGSSNRGACGLGSVKTNIGHLEAAAGIAGFLKVLLAMQHGVLPATQHCREINPHIRLDGGPFHIVRENEPWQRLRGRDGALAPRRAGVSSFGFGGANCHVVVEEYAPDGDVRDDAPAQTAVVIPLSARTGEQLRDRAAGLLQYLETTERPAALASIAWTLQAGRAPMAERAGWTVASHAELADGLRAFLAGDGGRAAEPGTVLARWLAGDVPDWRAQYGARTPRRAHLPAYPFARERYWIPGREADAAGAADSAVRTTLLTPRWAERRPVRTGVARRVVILCGGLVSAQGAMEGVRCVSVESPGLRADSRFADVSRQVFDIIRDLVAEAHEGRTLVQVLTDEPVDLALGGLLRTAALEHPWLTGQVIFLEDGARSGEDVAAIAAENTAEDGLVRYRGGVRTVCTWDTAAPQPGGAGVPWRDGGVYLITGGAGGIGAVVARRIAQDVARPVLVLTGRSARDARIDALLGELRAAGADARYEQADVSRWEEVRFLVARVREEAGDIHGVIHSAGVIRDAVLTRKTAEEWEEVLAPKVAGLVNLDRAIGSAPLGFLIAFSSGAAVTGNPGQADYATANAFVDVFAAERATRVAAGECSGRTLSVAWPLWKDGGMTVDEAGLSYLWQSRGLSPMESAEGLTALTDAWALGTDRVWVHHGDPARVLEPAAPKPEPTVPSGRLARETLRLLTALYTRVTKLAPGAVDADEQLGSAGLDSITVLQLNRELATVFGGVSKTLFYEFPTLRTIATHLADRYATEARAWTGVEPDPIAPRQGRGELRDQPETTRSRTTAPPAERSGEPIAVIGMSGRYPGAPDLAAFWENLKTGRDGIREVPADRWPLDGFFEPDRSAAVATGRSYSKWGGFLDGFADFDPLFFRISPREAYAMDPQERLFLQASWEVLEDAGYARAELARRHGRRVGVFAGVTKSGHARHGAARLPSGETVVPALSFASLSARTSYVLDLRGPSLTLDTMCSASLTAIHEACEHLRQGACELAIAGGVNLYLHQLDYVELCSSNMLAAGPECRSFGDGGDGFVPGEGVGAVLLKPLSRALADGDRVLAVIRGTSINHGGRSHGYTVPSPGAQAELVRDALTRAGVSARDVGYVEAHGTGTELGDPIEVTGLTQAFEQDTADRQFCALGSVKSAIGHLEAAAGIAGLTKVVLQMQHRQLAPSLHADTPNPNIDFARTPFFVQRELAPWQPERGPRIASVSSFGAGGSNAHVILEEYDAAPAAPADGGEHLVVLSARTPEQLHDAAARLADFLERNTDVAVADLAFTLQTGREAMKERLATVASSTDGLRRTLSAFLAEGDGAAGVHRGTAGRARGILAEIAADEDLQEFLVARWGRAGKLGRLGALWADGADLDWHALDAGAPRRRIALPTYPFARDRYWIGDLAPVSAGTTTSAPPAAEPEETMNVTPDGQLPRLVREKIARALAMQEHEIDGALAFADYGLDSILAVRVVHELNEALSLDLSTSVIYDHSTADRLTAHVLAEHRKAVPASVPVPAQAPAPRNTGRTPIAVVGMSGRFAGSDSLDELWDHLAAGDDLVTEATRWDIRGSRCTRGAFLDGIDEFDPLFFNISGVEAAVMDPQQRLLLEESWKALEDAGYAGRQMNERRCGVYVGCWDGDYQTLVGENPPAQAFWGNTASFVPSRISYFLNLKGPAIAVDTSCSSSLVAIDLACKDLWAGETSMALAGGVYVQSTPRLYELAGRAGMLSPTGRCHAFDHRADGFVPGEAVGVLVLKRLEDALADGDHVHGVIHGSGVNHDGATNGITAPSSVSQESLLSEVYASYGIDVEQIQLVEAHGTGTKLGDPIEFEALTRAFRKGTDRTGYCALGSVKTNLGHTQHAAGVVGMIKVLLALKNEQIPASLHFEAANEAVDLAASPFYLPTRTRKWEAPGGGPRRGVVSSFGASGTNAHFVIEEAPAALRARTPRSAHLIVLSAHSREQLAQQVTRLAAHCRREPALDCGDIAYTLLAGREHFAHRFACVVRDRDELLTVLDEGLGGARAFTGEAAPAGSAPSAAEAVRRCSPASPAYRGDLETLAGLYVQGAALDHDALFAPGDRNRVPLPAYPFARESHWAAPAPPRRAARPVSAPEVGAAPPAGGALQTPVTPAADEPALPHRAATSQSAPAAAAAPSPRGALQAPVTHASGEPALREGHASTPALPHQTATSASAPTVPTAWPTRAALHAPTTLTGDESVLRDHLVHGRRVLPGVAHLEMAREAAARALGAGAAEPLTMRNVTWVRPLVCDGTPVEVDVRVKPAPDGGVAFEVTADATVFSEGRVARSTAPRPAPADLAALRAACPAPVSAARIGEALVSMGISHGPALRAIGEAHAGPGTVLARLTLPAAAEGGAEYVLHPALMDSAIQASMALHLDGTSEDTTVPFALDRLDLFAPCTSSMWAVVRTADSGQAGSTVERLDIDLLDADGAVCVRMTGYASRRSPAPVPAYFAPVWDAVPAAEGTVRVPSRQDRVLVVGGTDAQRAAVAFDHPDSRAWPLGPEASVDEIARALQAAGPLDHLVWIAPGTAPEPGDAAGFVAAQEEGVIAAFRMIKALVRTGHDARPLGITLVTRRALATHEGEDVLPAHAGLHGLFGSLGREYTHWTVRRTDLDDTVWPAGLTALPAHSHGDTWVLRSGQWLGRRLAPCATGPAPAAPYREGGVYVVIGGAGGLGTAWTQHVVERHGARVVWIGRREHDASVEAQLRTVHGRGEVHYISADATDPAALRRAHAEVKSRYGRIDGVIQAALVLRDQTLAAMDEAAFRAALAAKVDASAAMAQVFADEPLDFVLFFSSLQSFSTAAGQSNYAAGCTFADSYAHLLSRQWACPVKVMNWGWWGSIGSAASDFHKQHMARWGLLSIEPPEGMAALGTLLGGPQARAGFVKVTGLDALEAIDPATRATVYGRAAERLPAHAVTARAAAPDVRETLRAMAEWRSAERDPILARMTRAHLQALGADTVAARQRAGILDRYTTWLDHALRMAPDSAPPLDVVAREWDERRAAWSADPDKKAELALVDATLRALPDILTGRTRPTDVMFPRGSVELVEGCYRNNRVADTYNRAMADAAVSVVTERLRREPGARLRILEIGAGTGGTSVGMFAALRPYQEHIETYTYTDLSKAFLNRARAEFGPDVPYLTCTRFDAEQPLAGQGIPAGSFDLVIAANVLHATSDTRNTLRNAKAALRDGGWLLLNELAQFDVFSHLTFGLLEGWWLFEDAPLRIPGSPALSPESWREVLHGEGFPSVLFLLPEADALGQRIIAAESDGVARQRVALQAAGTTTAPAPTTVPAQAPAPVPAPAPAPQASEPAPVPQQPVADRGETLTAYLREKAAETLRIPAEKIDPTVSLSQYGMDSILVLQLTNALREDLGEVSSTLLFDAESVEALAAHFLAEGGERVDALMSHLRPDAPAAPAPEPAPAAAGLGTLFRTAARTGKLERISTLLAAAAELRPTYAAGGPEPETMRLADGARDLPLVCVPSLIAPTGAYQFLKFAAALRDRREVWTAALPGYGTGEPLPETLEAAADRLARTLQQRFAGRRFALAAYSSGGWMAHETVRRLEALGAPPAALVLLDSPGSTGTAMCRGMATITRRLVDQFPQLPVEDDQLTAMAWYAELFDGWRPAPVTVPTLFVGAQQECLQEVLGDGLPDWRPDWHLPHSRREVTGNHFSMLEEDAATTAAAVHQWLTEHVG